MKLLTTQTTALLMEKKAKESTSRNLSFRSENLKMSKQTDLIQNYLRSIKTKNNKTKNNNHKMVK